MLRCAILGLAVVASPLDAQSIMPAGIWTNTEDAYFAEAEGRKQPDWIGIEVGETGEWRWIDPFGKPLGGWSAEEIAGLEETGEGQWQVNGSELREARPFICWISVRMNQRKQDGSEDWNFQRDLKTFDQGGRIVIAGNETAPEVTLRLRNVTWAKGSRNKPSLVLYVHRDDPERAVSYAWSSPDASLIGINLRWVQASCSPVSG